MVARIHAAASRRSRHDIRCPGARAGHRRAHPLHVELHRAADALRGGVRGGPDRRTCRGGVDDGGLDAWLVPGARVLAPRRSGHGDRRGRARARGREIRQEPLARHHGRQPDGDREVSRVRPRDERAHQLDRRRVRADQRRTDVHDAARRRRAAPRSRHQPAPGMAAIGDRPGRNERRRSSVSRARLRHARRFPVPPGQSERPRVHHRREEALPRERGRGWPVRRREGGEGSRSDGPRAAPLLGIASLRQVSLHQHPHRHRAGRRPRAPELDRPHHEPVHDEDATRLPWLAGAGQPRVLSRLERQTPAPRGARAFRLRERGSHPEPVDRGRRDGLLRGAAGAPRRSVDAGRVPGEPLQPHRGRADGAGPSRAVGGARVLRCVDQGTTVPTRIRSNVSISYYEKGLVIAFLLDAKIRNVTKGARSLDDVMRAAYRALCRRARLHARRFPFGGGTGCGDEPGVVLGQRRSRARPSSTTRRR